MTRSARRAGWSDRGGGGGRAGGAAIGRVRCWSPRVVVATAEPEQLHRSHTRVRNGADRESQRIAVPSSSAPTARTSTWSTAATGSVSEFARNSDGSLTQLSSPNNCIAQTGSSTNCAKYDCERAGVSPSDRHQSRRQERLRRRRGLQLRRRDRGACPQRRTGSLSPSGVDQLHSAPGHVDLGSGRLATGCMTRLPWR